MGKGCQALTACTRLAGTGPDARKLRSILLETGAVYWKDDAGSQADAAYASLNPTCVVRNILPGSPNDPIELALGDIFHRGCIFNHRLLLHKAISTRSCAIGVPRSAASSAPPSRSSCPTISHQALHRLYRTGSMSFHAATMPSASLRRLRLTDAASSPSTIGSNWRLLIPVSSSLAPISRPPRTQTVRQADTAGCPHVPTGSGYLPSPHQHPEGQRFFSRRESANQLANVLGGKPTTERETPKLSVAPI